MMPPNVAVTTPFRTETGIGADITVLDRSVDVLGRLAVCFGSAFKTVYSTRASLEEYALQADLVVGAVLVYEAVDRGGCFETSRSTNHADPIYFVDDVVHFCVANMPEPTPSTSTYAPNNLTLAYGLALADEGYKTTLRDNLNFRDGLNVHKGEVTYKAVADDLGYDYVDAASALGG